ncbi:MAG: tRNA (N6-threonylcarbamoyladenosine(37)-N6)-methyltransferase TrmO [Gammaproteobacteria bacterium]|nr:MAG: tRNA (N6-threonylcarbamoyladenosine(37)-N6)-methyltransferase TrmO [Gammaproteobacteria bacterium]
MQERQFSFHPIGHVEHAVPDDEVPRRRRDLVCDVVLAPELAPALDGIEDYSHIFVLFWMHRLAGGPCRLRVHPRGREDLPLTGVLATRSPHRPNPVGLAVCELLERRDYRLTVRRLDAFNGTPVIDIKPYDLYDRVERPRVPEWWLQRSGGKGFSALE